MSANRKVRMRFVSPLLFIVAVVFAASVPRMYDHCRLVRFVHQIRAADRIRGTYFQGSASITITGEEVQKILRIVSSAHSARPRWGLDWACAYLARATFFEGTNVLGDIEIIEICGDLFLVRSKKSPFRDETGDLRSLVYKPIIDAYHAEMDKKLGIQ